MEWVSLSAVVDPLERGHGAEVVERFCEEMRRGDRFPPISVLAVGGRYLVADGHKRLAAFERLGGESLPVEIWTLGMWLGDQLGQARRNLRKNGRILASLFTDPRQAARLAGSTVRHWLRVARSLFRHGRRALTGR